MAKTMKKNDQQPVKKGGPSKTVTLLENELMGMLQRSCKPVYLDLSRTRIDFRLTLTAAAEVYAALDDDPLLLAKVTEAASAEYERARKALKKKLRDTDGKMGAQKSKIKKRLRDQFLREVQNTAAALKKNLKSHTKEVRKCVTTLLQKIIDIQEQVREGQGFVEKAEAKLKMIQGKKSKVVDLLEKGLFLTDLALGGSTISWDGATSGAQKAGDLLLNIIDPFIAEVDANLADELR